MRLRFITGVVALFIVAAIVLAIAVFDQSLLSPELTAEYQPISQAPTSIIDTAIARENAHFGTDSWRIPILREASTQIQAYAGAMSVSPGQRLTFYVSTQREGTHYFSDIYRLGWYQGYGGRLMASQADLIGHAQGYYNQVTHRLQGCVSCHVDTNTGLVEANWKPSYSLMVPLDWTTGIYLAKLTDGNGLQTYVPFDVRGSSSSRYVVVTPDTTNAAYNDWGGQSLYDANSNVSLNETISAPRGVKVSFDRPFAEGYGSGQVLVFEINAVHWLERQGYDLSYISNVELHEDPAQLLHHRAYLSIGHDEYWTKEMRDGVEYARDRGVGLAFLGANAAYWQMRFEPDSSGTANRTIVCYKVQTALHDLTNDPFYGVDNSRVTAEWRDPVLARPENALIGIMYSNLTHRRVGFPWQVNSGAHSHLLDGTGLLPGQQYGCDLVGYEWDRIFANGATPNGLQVLGISITMTNNNTFDSSNTTYYVASSGAMVFATGSIYWTAGLDNYRFYKDESCTQQSLLVPGMQMLMARVMDALSIRHRGLALTSVPSGITFSNSDTFARSLEGNVIFLFLGAAVLYSETKYGARYEEF